jgi:hypothetical protein
MRMACDIQNEGRTRDCRQGFDQRQVVRRDMDGIERAQGFFEGFMTVLKAAEMRLMSAATAVALAGGAE